MITTNKSVQPVFRGVYPICDADACRRAGWDLVDFAAACLDGGARVLQVRAKHAAARAFLAAAAAIVARADPYAAAVIVNDRADVARIAGAAGVHVGQDDLTPAAARAVVGDAAIVGLSTHTPEQISAAGREPIAYLAVGPIFGTATKETGYDAVGPDRVREAVAVFRASDSRRAPVLPVVAIGGITLENAAQVIAAGASAVAVISDLLATNDPAARVRQYLERLTADA